MKSILCFIAALIITGTMHSQTIAEAENLIVSERFDDAVSMLHQIKQADPQNQYVYFLSGEAVLKSFINDPYSDSKNNVGKKALGFFNEGFAKDSLNPLNLVGFGIIELFKNNDTLAADVHFKKAVSLIPTKKKKINDLHVKTFIKLETAELYSAAPRYAKAAAYNAKLLELRPKSPEVYIAHANVLLAQGRASDAIAQYRKALHLENTALTNVMIGKIYYSARNTEEAKNYFEKALEIDNKFAPAYKGLGDVFYKMGKNDLAKENYAKFVELTGNNIPAKINYVRALYKAQDYEGTIANALDVIKADTSKNYLYRLIAYSYADKPKPEFGKALDYIQKFFSKATPEEIIVKDYNYYSKILLNLKRDSNDIRQGIEMLEKAYLADTTNRDAIVDIIKEAYRYKVYDIEIKYLTKMINSGANTPGNYSLLGKAYYYSKEYEKADSVYDIMISMDSSNIEAHLWKAYSLSSLDPNMEMGLAKPAFEKILEVTGNKPEEYKKERFDAFSYLGSFYMFSKPADYPKAIEYIKKSADVDPENQQIQYKAYNTLAFAYYKSKQWIDAKATYEKILAMKPDDPNAQKALKDIDKFLKASEKQQQ